MQPSRSLQPTFEDLEAMIIIAQLLPHPDETFSVDLPDFFMFHLEHENWYFIKRPTSKLYYEEYYMVIEKKTETRATLDNIIWYDFLEQACKDPEGTDHKLHRLVSPNIRLPTPAQPLVRTPIQLGRLTPG